MKWNLQVLFNKMIVVTYSNLYCLKLTNIAYIPTALIDIVIWIFKVVV